ncbi:hypothetical protein GP486_003835 [Trichoglossum hirsutum]|uniref:FHA domain-containing protein n=1 Tax=Trichoglossum hirsutum TaxID=265104 RepID=A0A9P8LC68_9PEZI|nr:hypothetical protein GP486_003835 [Trichoglossum hirsutum]
MSAVHQPSSILPSQHMLQPQVQQNGTRSAAGQGQTESPAVLYLLPMNGTFERKTISVPFFPDVLRIGRQTNAKTLPTPMNGYFDSKVLSRQHAEIWADRNGKIWIRDVKSSNGTFVNGQRLSAENRDSEPHELREGDILELGIDIVSEDQKTVVHHKVAARVELAGFYGNGSNTIDLNFGDIDPGSGGSLINPPLSQNSQIRGRAGSQGSINGSTRIGSGPPSVAGSNTSVMGQQRHLNFWLTPVTMEQIVKKLTTELRAAKQQSIDLQKTGEFFDSLLAQKPIVEKNEHSQHEASRENLPNGIPIKVDTKARFSDPPAPPPQQPLPEKPDFSRTDSGGFSSSGSLKWSDTDKLKSALTSSQPRSEPPQQYHSLVEALASAKRELDSKIARVTDLEDLLQKERKARESAEDRALRLERASHRPDAQSTTQDATESVVEETFETVELNERRLNGAITELEEFGANVGEVERQKEENAKIFADAAAAEASAARLHQRLENTVAERDEMKQLMEKYRRRMEVAEEESASSRKSLAEMIEKIRREEAERKSKLEARATYSEVATQTDGDLPEDLDSPMLPSPSMGKADRGEVANGKVIRPAEAAGPEDVVSTTLMRSRGPQDHLYQSGPYASILGVVVLGVGLMAFLNGWQKAER